MNKWVRSALIGVASGISVWLVAECDAAISIPGTFPRIISYTLPVVLLAGLIFMLSDHTLSALLVKIAGMAAVAWPLFTYFNWAWWLYGSISLHESLSGWIAAAYCIAAAMVAILVAIPITFSRIMKDERD